MIAIKRALLSCHDKTGLETLGKALADLGVELIASGGTATYLQHHGLRVRSVEEFAGIGEQLDGRVKTLHPKIHGGILAKRDDPAHIKSVGADGLIDLVVVNLYPFEQTTQKPGVTLPEVIEQIDIGGVALIRAAAKNFKHVAVLTRSEQYPSLIKQLRDTNGTLSETDTRALAAAAFELTTRYDRLIAEYIGGQKAAAWPTVAIGSREHQPLRYGENPHQSAAWHVGADGPKGLAGSRQLQGKELSYNNVLDLDAVVRCLADFSEPTCVIAKHATPCGIASAGSLREAFERALACDSESAFGGIVGVNRSLDRATAEAMASMFLEVIVAPKIDDAAAAVFAKKTNLRLLELAIPSPAPFQEWRTVLGGYLTQQSDAQILDQTALRVVTKRQPTKAEHRDLLFAWVAAKHVKSNAIVIAKDAATIAIGAGQPSRVRSVRLAMSCAGAQAKGAVLASDGFFPFPDNVEVAATAGITAVIQPGGSVKDPDVIAAADAAGIAMLFTGMRHFRH